MLQQTRVETVIPYFGKWMRLFPTVSDLANASEQEVLSVWEGLGYYRRARNLHKAAKLLVEKHNGRVPHNLDDLHALPGIGRYTAGAIASMAFGMDEPTLDGNLRRVFARLFDIKEPVDTPAGEKVLWALAAGHLPKGRAGDYNQALMDLGATICTPRNPHCFLCPLMGVCEARQHETQGQRPVFRPKKALPHYIQAAGLIVRETGNALQVLLAKRPPEGLLGGMWEFPTGRVDSDPAMELTRVLKKGYRLTAKRKEALGSIRHVYTHFKVTVHVFRCELVEAARDKKLRWVRENELANYPMGKVDRQISRMMREEGGVMSEKREVRRGD